MGTSIRELAMLLLLPLAVGCSSGEAADDIDESAPVTRPAATAEDPSGSDAIPLPRPTGDRQIGVRLREYRIEMTRDTISAGEVEFQVVNAGTTMHLFVVRKSDYYEITPHLLPGESNVLKVRMEPGDYQILCTVRDEFDHYSEGMNGHLIVQ